MIFLSGKASQSSLRLPYDELERWIEMGRRLTIYQPQIYKSAGIEIG